tara:strand:- start:1464 stop:4178 length:2715 start_codon:yes stop_codon:yes gene_type:complete
MATVPTAKRVTADAIAPQRTVLPGVTEYRGAGAVAKAQTQFGEKLSASADDWTKIGASIQFSDEKLDKKNQTNVLKRTISDHTDGNKERGIEGWKSRIGQNSLDTAAQSKAELRKVVTQQLADLKSAQWVKDELSVDAESYLLENEVGQDLHNITQRKAARLTTNKTTLRQTNRDLDNIVAGDIEGEDRLIDEIGVVALDMARQDGLTDKNNIDEYIKSYQSAAIGSRIKFLQSTDELRAAKDLYDRTEGLLSGPLKLELSKLVETGGVKAATLTEFDNITRVPGRSHEQMIKAAADPTNYPAGQNPAVRIATMSLVRSHVSDLRGIETSEKKSLRTSAVGKAQRGEVNTLTVAELVAVSETPGMLLSLQKISERKAVGRPQISNRDIKAELWDIIIKRSHLAQDLDLDSSKYIEGLSSADYQMFQLAIAKITNAEVAEDLKNEKTQQKAAQGTAVRTAIKSKVDSFDLSKEARGELESLVQQEVERLTDSGVIFTKDSQYIEIAEGLMITGNLEEPWWRKDLFLFERSGTLFEFSEDDVSGVKFTADIESDKVVALAEETGLLPERVQQLGNLILSGGSPGQITGSTLLRAQALETAPAKGGMAKDITTTEQIEFNKTNNILISKLFKSSRIQDVISKYPTAGKNEVAHIITLFAQKAKPPTEAAIANELEKRLALQARRTIVPTAQPEPIVEVGQGMEDSDPEGDPLTAVAEVAPTAGGNENNAVIEGRPAGEKQLSKFLAAIPSEQKQIINDEGGDVSQTYVDRVKQPDGSTKNVLTAGVGHRLTIAEQRKYPEGAEIPAEVRAMWWANDYEEASQIALKFIPKNAPEELRLIITNMSMMGAGSLSKFKNLRKALKAKNYQRAAEEMIWTDPDNHSKGNTAWYLQTKGRAKALVKRMRKIK